MRDRFKMIIAGYLLLIKDGKILLGRRYNTGYEDGKYSLPAGHIEEHETVMQGTAREIEEEIGIKVKPNDLVLVHVMHRRADDERIDLFFTAKRWRGMPMNKEPHKCDELQWFMIKKLPTNVIPYIAEAIENHLKRKFYSEFGWRKS
jgi:mutator protein MutT